jgi:hypothetical protein
MKNKGAQEKQRPQHMKKLPQHMKKPPSADEQNMQPNRLEIPDILKILD